MLRICFMYASSFLYLSIFTEGFFLKLMLILKSIQDRFLLMMEQYDVDRLSGDCVDLVVLFRIDSHSLLTDSLNFQEFLLSLFARLHLFHSLQRSQGSYKEWKKVQLCSKKRKNDLLKVQESNKQSGSIPTRATESAQSPSNRSTYCLFITRK